MNGLNKTSKLAGLNDIGLVSLSIFFSVAAVLYVMATAFTGGGVA